MCNFRGSNRRNQSFLAEHICYRLRFFSLEAADRVVLWPKNQVPVATTDYSGGVHQAVTGVAKGGHESSPALQCSLSSLPVRRLSRTVYPAINCWATFTTSLAGRDCPRPSCSQLLSIWFSGRPRTLDQR